MNPTPVKKRKLFTTSGFKRLAKNKREPLLLTKKWIGIKFMKGANSFSKGLPEKSLRGSGGINKIQLNQQS